MAHENSRMWRKEYIGWAVSGTCGDGLHAIPNKRKKLAMAILNDHDELLDTEDKLFERELREVDKEAEESARKKISGDRLFHALCVKLIMRVHGCSRLEAEARIRTRNEVNELSNSNLGQTSRLKEKLVIARRGKNMREILRKG